MSLYTNCGLSRSRICAGHERVRTQRRRGERMSLLSNSQSTAYDYELGLFLKPSEEGEREYV